MEKQKELQNFINEYEKTFVKDESSQQAQMWGTIKSKIDEIIESKHAPIVSERAKRPVILIATPEIVSLPANMGNLANLITTGDGGGLADISAALVAQLNSFGVNVHVALPEYSKLFSHIKRVNRNFYEDFEDDARIHLISDGILADAKKVYGDSSKGLDLIDLRRANAFMRGVIYRILPKIRTKGKYVLVHCNDWMTGLIPAAAKAHGIKSLMTFHNVFTQYQWPKGLYKHGIDVEAFWEHLYFKKHPSIYDSYEEIFNNNLVDFMTSGLFSADFINTVSPTFLKEVVKDYFTDYNIIPDHMRDVIKTRFFEGSAVGILNAPSVNADPRIDKSIVENYDFKTNSNLKDVQEGKRINKLYFQKKLGLKENVEIPLFFWPSRIARPQKGFELLLEIIPALMEVYGNDNLQIAVVGNGDSLLVKEILRLASMFPGVSYQPFDRDLSQCGKAGADFILMPSLYEPCGTPQVEGPRYGTMPVVRRTGGLADTVEHLSHGGLIGNGFVFEDYTPEGLWFGMSQAIRFYNKGITFRTFVQRRIMRESFAKFNIQKTAKWYIEIYEEIFRRNG